MTLGQCSITAFLAQDIFGGKVYGIERPNGSIHCYNIVNEYVFDLTSEQFGDEKLDYSVGTEQFRNTEHHFGNGEKELMNMTEMNGFHRVIQEYMDQHSQKGLFPVLNGTTIGGNRTIAELKAQNAMEETLAATRNAKEIKEAADQSVVDANEQVKQVQSEILNMKESKLIAEEDREKWLEELEKKELPALKELKDGLRDLGGG